MRENTLYLTLKCYAWLFQVRLTIGEYKLVSGGAKEEEIEEFKELANSFAQISRWAGNVFMGNISPRLMRSFQGQPFLGF